MRLMSPLDQNPTWNRPNKLLLIVQSRRKRRTDVSATSVFWSEPWRKSRLRLPVWWSAPFTININDIPRIYRIYSNLNQVQASQIQVQGQWPVLSDILPTRNLFKWALKPGSSNNRSEIRQRHNRDAYNSETSTFYWKNHLVGPMSTLSVVNLP